MPNYLSKGPVSSNFEQTYVSQYVPLPLEQFARAQAKQEATQNMYEGAVQQQQDANWKLSGAANEDNEYIKGLRNSFDEAASQLVNKDLTQRENQSAVKDLIKGVSKDSTLNTILANKSRYDEWQKNVAKAKEEGHYTRENDMGVMSYYNYVSKGGYKSGGSIDPTVMKYVEERPKMEQFYNDMGDNGSDDLGKVGEVYYNQGWKGISNDKEHGYRIKNRATQAFGSYINTPEGQQGLRRFQLLDTKTQKAFKGGAEEYVFKQFLDAGLERVHGVSNSGLAAALNTKRKEEKEEVNLFAGLASNEIPSTLLDGLEVKYNSKGNIQGDGKGIFANIGESIKSGNYNPIDMFTKWKNDDRLSDEQNTRLKSVLVGSKLNGVSDKEYINHFNKTWAPVIPQPLTGKAIKSSNDAFYNGGAGLWSHMVVSKDGKGSMGLLEALENEFGDVPDPKKDAKGFLDFMKLHKVQVTGAYAPNKLSARPIEITVDGSTFMADLTNGGKNMNGVSEDDKLAQNLAKLNAGEQIEETDSKGNTVIYYKDIKTGKVLPKIIKK